MRDVDSGEAEEGERVTIRERIAAIQKEVGEDELLPLRASHILLELTSLLGNVNDQIRVCDAAYAEVLLECLRGDEAASRAKIRAETTPQYRQRQEARDTSELVIELIRSLKIFIRQQQEEMRLAR